MAEPLGISGHIDISDIEKALEKLDSQLSKVGVDFSESSKVATEALHNIANATDKDVKQKMTEIIAVLAKARKEAEEALSKVSLKGASEEVKKLRGELDSVNKLLEDNSKEAERLTAEIAKRQEKISSYTDSIAKVEAYRATHPEAGESTSQIYNIEDKLKSEQKKLDALMSELEMLHTSTQQLNDDRVSITKSIDDEIEKEKKLAEAKKEAEKQAKELAALEKARQKELEKVSTPQKQYNILKQEIMQLKEEYNRLTEAERESAKGESILDQVDEKQRQAAELVRIISGTQKKLKNYSDSQLGFHAIAEGANLASSALGTMQGVVTMLGISEKDYQEVQTAIQTSLAANNLLTQANTALRKESALMTQVSVIQTWASQKATDAETAAKGRNTAATVLLTAKQRIFNLVAKANPYLLLLTAITTVVGAVWLAVRAFNAHNEELQKAKEKEEELKKTQEEWAKDVSSTATKQIVSYKSLQREWEKTGDSQTKKNKFIKDNRKAFEDLGYSISNINQVEGFLVDHTQDVVNAIMARAKANAYANLIAKSEEEYIQKQLEAEDAYKNKHKAGDVLNSDSGLQSGGYNVRERLELSGYNQRIVKEYVINESEAQRLNEKELSEVKNELQKKHTEIIKRLADKMEEATNEQLQAEQTLFNLGIGKAGEAGEDWNKIQEERLKKRQKLQEDLAEIEKRSQQLEISLMEDGSKKRLAQIDADYKEELQQLDKRREQLAKEQGRELNTDENAVYDRQEELLYKQYQDRIRKELDDERKKAEETGKLHRQAMDDYLVEYGNYQERREAIARQYNDKIAEAATEGEKMSLRRQMEEALSEADFDEFKNKINWEEIFGDLGSVSLKRLSVIRQQLRAFLNDGTLTAEQYKVVGEKIRDIEDAISSQQGTIKATLGLIIPELEERRRLTKEQLELENEINELQGRQARKNLEILNLKEKIKAVLGGADISYDGNISASSVTDILGQVDKDSPLFKQLSELFSQLGIKEGELGSTTDKLGTKMGSLGSVSDKLGSKFASSFAIVDTIIQKVNQNIQSLPMMFENFGVNMDSNFGQGVVKFAKSSEEAAAAFDSLKSGDIVGIIGHVTGAVVSLGESVMEFFGLGADWSSYNRMLEDFTKLNKVWDEVIAKKREYLSMSYGDEALRIGAETQALARRSIESYRTLGLELLNSGASIGSHSIGVRQRKAMTDEGWSQLRQAAQSIGLNYNSIANDRMEGLFRLTSQQLEDLKAKAPVFWAHLNEDVQGYLNAIIDGEARLEDIQEELASQLTGTSFDNVSSGFWDMLSDMSSDVSKFTDDVNKKLFDAFVNNKIKQKYNEQLQGWYERLTQYAGSDGLDENEISNLREQYKSIAEAALAERDTIAKITGYGESLNPDQQAAYNSLEKFTYDQADDVIARLTAVQIITEHQDEKQRQMLEGQSIMVEEVKLVSGSIRNIDSNVNTLVDIQRQSLGQLERINDNTLPIKSIADEVVKLRKLVENQ